MTDPVHDRIAAVLRDKLLEAIDGAINGVDNIYIGDYVEESVIHLPTLADAVIEALALTREDPNQAWIEAGLPIKHRYVTEWTADD